MLFKNTQKLLEYAELTTAVNFVSVRPTLRMVEAYHVAPLLGNELYSALDTAYALITDEAALPAKFQLLLDKCRCVIGPMLCYMYAPKAEVKLGDGGLTKHKDAAFQYQSSAYREANMREAEAATELLLSFLDENRDQFPEWTSSASFKSYRSLFIRSGSEFQELFPSHTPHRNYAAMRSKMQDVEEQSIRPAIGDSLFAYLKEKGADPAYSFSDKENQLLQLLRKAVASFTVAAAVPMLQVRIDAGGITVMNEGFATRDADAKKTAAGSKDLVALVASCAETGRTWLDAAKRYLEANKDSFPAWTIPQVKADHCEKPEFKSIFGMF